MDAYAPAYGACASVCVLCARASAYMPVCVVCAPSPTLSPTDPVRVRRVRRVYVHVCVVCRHIVIVGSREVYIFTCIACMC